MDCKYYIDVYGELREGGGGTWSMVGYRPRVPLRVSNPDPV